jgi:hypothetical protein
MCTRIALINADVAKSPVALVAHVAKPITLICPCQTICAECPALQSFLGILSCECPPTISSTGRNSWRHVTTCLEHVRWFQVS